MTLPFCIPLWVQHFFPVPKSIAATSNPEHAIRKAIEGRREKAEYAVDEVDPEATPEFAAEVKAAAEAAPSAEEGGDE